MSFIQCIIESTSERAEFLSEYLMELGAEAVTFEDAKQNPIFEPPPQTEILWNATRVIGLFLADADLNYIEAELKKVLEEQEIQNIRFQPLEDQDWVSLTQTREALCFSDTLCIGPKELQTNNTAAYLILDPGLAFGTGTHPTTQLCLKYLADHPPKNKVILDYGCGSGILGLAALKLGAKSVLAVDHDPQALYSTRSNAEKNDFTPNQIKTYLPNEFQTEVLSRSMNKDETKNEIHKDLNEIQQVIKVDIILANILANPLIELAPKFAEWIKPGGLLLLSGILKPQIDSIITHYSPWFSELEQHEQEDWASLVMKLNF